jgi:hypothetical protein
MNDAYMFWSFAVVICLIGGMAIYGNWLPGTHLVRKGKHKPLGTFGNGRYITSVCKHCGKDIYKSRQTPKWTVYERKTVSRSKIDICLR